MLDKEFVSQKESQESYLEGLRRYKDRGVHIIIDGKECPESEWNRIFEVYEDGGFYMGDYVGAEQGCLKEIRFDRVYLCESSAPMNSKYSGPRYSGRRNMGKSVRYRQ